MKKLLFLSVLVLMFSALALAGSSGNSVQPEFYLFGGPLASNPQYNATQGGASAGFGGEVLSRSGLGGGIEFGFGLPDCCEGVTWSGGVGAGSVNGVYHFVGAASHSIVDPFATGGYSLYFGNRTTFQSGLNVGGGVNFWFSRHAAARFEIRYQGGINHLGGFSPFTGFTAFRFGVTFR